MGWGQIHGPKVDLAEFKKLCNERAAIRKVVDSVSSEIGHGGVTNKRLRTLSQALQDIRDILETDTTSAEYDR